VRCGYAARMVTSAHVDHTCDVSSQSQRKPTTYEPGLMPVGTVTLVVVTVMVVEVLSVVWWW
jgi:hypothetical protein